MVVIFYHNWCINEAYFPNKDQICKMEENQKYTVLISAVGPPSSMLWLFWSALVLVTREESISSSRDIQPLHFINSPWAHSNKDDPFFCRVSIHNVFTFIRTSEKRKSASGWVTALDRPSTQFCCCWNVNVQLLSSLTADTNWLRSVGRIECSR